MRREHVVVHKTPHMYSSHPCVAALASGDWLVAFGQSANREPFLHPPADPHYINLVTRSADQGRTWSAPQMAPDFNWYGVETPGIAQIANGDVLLNQWKFNWIPREAAYRRWLDGDTKLYVCPDAGVGRHEWTLAQAQADWDTHVFPYVRTDGGAFVHISDDDGRTWPETVPVDLGSYRGAFSPKGAIQLANGDVLLALGSHDFDPACLSFVVRSTDNGRSWKPLVEAARLEDCWFFEPSIAQTATGRIVCMSREDKSGYVYQSDSTDNGENWTPVRKLDIWGYPTHVIALANGRLLMVYGHRRPPYGIRVAVSDDDGATWSDPSIIRDFPNLNLGYPSVVEYAAGELFAVYYGEDADGVTCVHGTYFDLD